MSFYLPTKLCDYCGEVYNPNSGRQRYCKRELCRDERHRIYKRERKERLRLMKQRAFYKPEPLKLK